MGRFKLFWGDFLPENGFFCSKLTKKGPKKDKKRDQKISCSGPKPEVIYFHPVQVYEIHVCVKFVPICLIVQEITFFLVCLNIQLSKFSSF